MSEVAEGAVGAAETQKRSASKSDEAGFGCPREARLFITFLPLLTLYLYICIHRHGGSLVLPGPSILREIPMPTPRAALYVFGWLAFQIALDVLLPGKVVDSLTQRDGLKIKYR